MFSSADDYVYARSDELKLSAIFAAVIDIYPTQGLIVSVCFAANVFGKPKKNTDFLPYDGDGFKVLIPSKWNPSKEVEYPGQVLRYEDNFDSTTNLAVIVTPTDKKSITDFGSPEQFLSQVSNLFHSFLTYGSPDCNSLFTGSTF